MMTLLVGFLTFVLVVTCLLLMLLVLIQLPKKEAGAGVAFGGGATDALFGAGQGNALTKMTRYTATFFVGLALALSLLNSYRAKEGNRRLEEELRKKANAAVPIMPAATTSSPFSSLTTAPVTSNVPALQQTNALRTAPSNQTTTIVAAPTVVSKPVAASTNPVVALPPSTPAAKTTNPAAAPPK